MMKCQRALILSIRGAAAAAGLRQRLMDRLCQGDCCCCSPLTHIHKINHTHIYAKYKWEHVILSYTHTQADSLFTKVWQSHTGILAPSGCLLMPRHDTFRYSFHTHINTQTKIHSTRYMLEHILYVFHAWKSIAYTYTCSQQQPPHLKPQRLSPEPGLWLTTHMRISPFGNKYAFWVE